MKNWGVRFPPNFERVLGNLDILHTCATNSLATLKTRGGPSVPSRITVVLLLLTLLGCSQTEPWPKEEVYARREVCESKELDIRHFHGTRIDKAGTYEYLTIDDRPSLGIRLIWQNFNPNSRGFPYYYVQENKQLKEIDYNTSSALYDKYFGKEYEAVLLTRFSKEDLDKKFAVYFKGCTITERPDSKAK